MICPPGTYQSGSDCVLCPIGTFQLRDGQTSCTQCPAITSTKFLGAKLRQDCLGKNFIFIWYSSYFSLNIFFLDFRVLSSWKLFSRWFDTVHNLQNWFFSRFERGTVLPKVSWKYSHLEACGKKSTRMST